MTTKRERRARVAARTEEFFAEQRRTGQEAQRRDQAYRERVKKQKADNETERLNEKSIKEAAKKVKAASKKD